MADATWTGCGCNQAAADELLPSLGCAEHCTITNALILESQNKMGVLPITRNILVQQVFN